MTPLMYAVMAGHSRIVELLQSHNATWRLLNNNNMNILHIAVKNEQIDMINWILTKKLLLASDVNHKDLVNKYF